ncbi:hypothetical protein C8P63_113106 [Melghirimyces profundicolus]|uniref:Uncharacterized protein n=1 Tax=Melghirimyces profundicolus TaxID=1242148 RepID=A0A2T6BSU8_9BACL|nr:hypothetical protein [Melghirimyces profundicolus]PTX59161.1 hypothetical protein C8P63_113106 [Melghirimyces profundicolus]
MKYITRWNQIPAEVRDQIIHIVNGIKWNVYDKPITLCDALADADGFTLLKED